MIRDLLRYWGIEFRRFPLWLHIFNVLCATALCAIALAGALALRRPAPARFVERGRLRHAEAVEALIRGRGIDALESELEAVDPSLRSELLQDLARVPHASARALARRLAPTLEIPAAAANPELEPILGLLRPAGLDRDLAALVLLSESGPQSSEPGRLVWLARLLRLETGPTVDRARPGEAIRAALGNLSPMPRCAPRLEAAIASRHPARPSRAEVEAALPDDDRLARLRLAVLCADRVDPDATEETLATIARLVTSPSERRRLIISTLVHRAPDATLAQRLTAGDAELRRALLEGLTFAPRTGLGAALWALAEPAPEGARRDRLIIAAAACGSEPALGLLRERAAGQSPASRRLRDRLSRRLPELPRKLREILPSATTSPR